MIVNSQTMSLKLPGEKIKKIRQEVHNFQSHPRPSACHLLGKLNATSPAPLMAPLFCRSLQVCLKQALASSYQNYQVTVHLSPQALEDLHWWELHLSSWNGRSLIIQTPTMTITSDASLQGWGALCNGIWTRGPWFPQEQSLHINCLELLAATLAVKTFAKEHWGLTILLQLDNTTAVAYSISTGWEEPHSQQCHNYQKICGSRSGAWKETFSSRHNIYQGWWTQLPTENPRIGPTAQNPYNLPKDQAPVGAPINRPVCEHVVNSTANIYQLETRPLSYRHKCLHWTGPRC